MKMGSKREFESPAGYQDFISQIMPFVPDLTKAVRKRVGDGDAVSDIVQDALLSAWRGRKSLSSVRNPRGWMMTITRRRIADYYRKKERRPEAALDQ